jgi:hypothetical protein
LIETGECFLQAPETSQCDTVSVECRWTGWNGLAHLAKETFCICDPASPQGQQAEMHQCLGVRRLIRDHLPQ